MSPCRRSPSTWVSYNLHSYVLCGYPHISKEGGHMPKPPFLSGLHLNVPPVCFCVLIHWIVTFDWEEVLWTSVFHSGEDISLCLYVRDVLQYVYGTGMTTFAMSSSYSLPVTLALFSIGSIHWVNPYPLPRDWYSIYSRWFNLQTFGVLLRYCFSVRLFSH